MLELEKQPTPARSFSCAMSCRVGAECAPRRTERANERDYCRRTVIEAIQAT